MTCPFHTAMSSKNLRGSYSYAGIMLEPVQKASCRRTPNSCEQYRPNLDRRLAWTANIAAKDVS
jgi:hypothetical protein